MDVQRSKVGTPASSHIQVRGNQPRKVQRKGYDFGGKKHIQRDGTVKWRLQALLQLLAFNGDSQFSLMMIMIVKI